MTDPFDVLRLPAEPVAPRTEFANDLRRRLGDLLDTVAPVERTTTMTVTPYLIVRRAADALRFYAEAFGAVEQERIVGADGRIGHAELTIGDSRLMLADEYPEVEALGPQTLGGVTCSFTIAVDDVDAAVQRAVAAGAGIKRPATDEFYGRSAQVVDPFGHRWTLNAPLAAGDREEYVTGAAADGFEVIEGRQIKHYDQGDLYYWTILVGDLDRARRFFGAVLGWRFDDEQGHVGNVSAPPGGLRADPEHSAPQLWFVVDDIHEAIARVLANGGTAEEPQHYDSGWAVDCVDDQGTRFSLSVPAAKYSR